MDISILNLSTWLPLILLVEVCTSNRHMICREVDEVFSDDLRCTPSGRRLQGPPGKRGARGEKGDRGQIGPPGVRGPDGILNQNAMDDFTAMILSKVNETILIKLEKSRRASGACHVLYNEKCYGLIRKRTNIFTLEKAKAECQELGGQLANIYDVEHYHKIVSFVRSDPVIAGKQVWFWLGMKYTSSTSTTSMRDGRPAPVLKWRPGYPRGTSSHMFMGVLDTESTTGIYNYDLPNPRDAVLCEF